MFSVLAAVVTAGGLAAFYLAVDGPPLNVSDLAMKRRIVAPEQNEFLLVNFASDGDFHGAFSDRFVDPFGSKEATETPWTAEHAREVIGKDRTVLDSLVKCLEKSDFQFPQAQTVEDLGGDMAWASFAGLLRQRAALELVEGRAAAAVETAFQLVDLGHRVENAQGALKIYLAGIGLKGFGLDVLRRIVSRSDMDVPALKPLIERLGAFPVRTEALADTFREEFQFGVRLVDSFEADLGFWGGFVLCPNDTKRILADEFRRMISNASLPDAERLTGLQHDVRELEEGVRNAVGRGFLVNALADGNSFIQQMDTTWFQLSVTGAVIALRCHVLEHGRLPERLDERVPRYLKTLPLSPLDGQPLRYSREGRTLSAPFAESVDVVAFSYDLDPAIERTADQKSSRE